MTRAPEELAVAVLLALVVIVAATRLAGWLLILMGQPPVIGELLTGILLGPTALERDLTPLTTALLLPVFFVLPLLQLRIDEAQAATLVGPRAAMEHVLDELRGRTPPRLLKAAA